MLIPNLRPNTSIMYGFWFSPTEIKWNAIRGISVFSERYSTTGHGEQYWNNYHQAWDSLHTPILIIDRIPLGANHRKDKMVASASHPAAHCAGWHSCEGPTKIDLGKCISLYHRLSRWFPCPSCTHSVLALLLWHELLPIKPYIQLPITLLSPSSLIYPYSHPSLHLLLLIKLLLYLFSSSHVLRSYYSCPPLFQFNCSYSCYSTNSSNSCSYSHVSTPPRPYPLYLLPVLLLLRLSSSLLPLPPIDRNRTHHRHFI